MTFQEFRQKAHESKTSKMVSDKWYNLERNVSVRLSWLLVRAFPKIRPTYVTLVSFFILLVVFWFNFLKEDDALAVYITIFQLVALYFITITDKIDGEISRVTDYQTQKGVYYDRGVHFFYPFIFYFTIGYFFHLKGGSELIFYLTILLSVFTIYLFSFREICLLIGDKIKTEHINFKDYIESSPRKRGRLPLLLRLVDYTTFMIYAWTLVYYVIVILLSIYNFNLAYMFYAIHIIISLAVVGYRTFYSYPKYKLFSKNNKK